ncbi:hypothetical protein E4U44_002025 [Claviceps purpurea]|nr:hypothetical protein E4U44_002025 [Claviceps purpurea]
MKAGESDASVAKIEMLLFDNLGNLSGYPSELPRNRGEGRHSPYCRGGAGLLSPFDFFRHRVWVWEQKPEIWGIIFRLKPGDKGDNFISRAEKRIYSQTKKKQQGWKRDMYDVRFALFGSHCCQAFNYLSFGVLVEAEAADSKTISP